MQYKLLQKHYNTELKLKQLNNVLHKIDPKIRDFIIQLNKMDGILTRFCCSGHFEHKQTYILGGMVTEWFGYSNPHIAFDNTPEAEKLSLFFIDNGFSKEYYNKMLFLWKKNSYVNWDSLAIQLNEVQK